MPYGFVKKKIIICIVFRPRATPGWGRGAPQTPQNPPPPKKNVCVRFRTTGTFWEKNLVGKKTQYLYDDHLV